MILGVYGSGGLGREVLDITKTLNAIDRKWERMVFINDFKPVALINDTELFTFDEFKEAFSPDSAKVVIAIGEPKVRQIIRDRVSENGYSLQTLIHPTAFIGTDTQIGDGSVIQYGSFISCNVKIGTNVLVQPNASIGHDSVIGSDTVVSSYVAISGACTIGERVYIGINVPVRENLSIGADTIIGMGSTVLRDIPGNVIAYGNPACPIRNNESGYVFKKIEG